MLDPPHSAGAALLYILYLYLPSQFFLVLVYFTAMYKHFYTGTKHIYICLVFYLSYFLVPDKIVVAEGLSQKAQWPCLGHSPEFKSKSCF